MRSRDPPRDVNRNTRQPSWQSANFIEKQAKEVRIARRSNTSISLHITNHPSIQRLYMLWNEFSGMSYHYNTCSKLWSVVRVTTEAPTDSDTGHCRRQAVSDSHAVKFSSTRLWAALECVICMVNEVLSVAHSYFWKWTYLLFYPNPNRVSDNYNFNRSLQPVAQYMSPTPSRPIGFLVTLFGSYYTWRTYS